jgi:hypothetical protein
LNVILCHKLDELSQERWVTLLRIGRGFGGICSFNHAATTSCGWRRLSKV